MNRLLAGVGVTLLLAVAAVGAQTPTVAGEVVKMDKPAARITLKHDGIRNLDMPAMTMSFHVRNARQLDEVMVGDRVRFTAERADGQYTVTMILKVPE